MPNYENETCLSCDMFTDGGECVDICHHPALDKKHWPNRRDRCDEFAPSLECRKVLALEAIPRYLECIADRMHSR